MISSYDDPKFFALDINSRTNTVSLDHLELAHLDNPCPSWAVFTCPTSSSALGNTTSSSPKLWIWITHSGCLVCWPDKLVFWPTYVCFGLNIFYWYHWGFVGTGYTMRMRGYQIYTAEGTAQGCVYHNPESELYNRLVPECRGVFSWLVWNCPMIYSLKMMATRNAHVPSIDFKCALAIYTKSRSSCCPSQQLHSLQDDKKWKQ